MKTRCFKTFHSFSFDCFILMQPVVYFILKTKSHIKRCFSDGFHAKMLRLIQYKALSFRAAAMMSRLWTKCFSSQSVLELKETSCKYWLPRFMCVSVCNSQVYNYWMDVNSQNVFSDTRMHFFFFLQPSLIALSFCWLAESLHLLPSFKFFE